jgi:hypothetical protein
MAGAELNLFVRDMVAIANFAVLAISASCCAALASDLCAF